MKTLLLLTLLWQQPAPAPVVLRMGTVAPDGTAWARELKQFGRDVEAATNGAVKVKFYFSSIAGDEIAVLDRVKRGQLDGMASGVACHRVMPSLRVTRIAGLFQTRGEAAYVTDRLNSELMAEAQTNGYQLLAVGGFGTDVIMSRVPIRTMAELRKTRLWIWDIDEVLRLHLPGLGMNLVPLPVEDAGHAIADGRVEGVNALAAAALAFQWSTQFKYFTDLRSSYLSGCLAVSNRAIDRLPHSTQEAIRAAAAKFRVRFEELGGQQDEQLLRVFRQQGMTQVEVTSSFRAEFLEAARAARERLGDQLVPTKLLAQVQVMLADYRAEHRAPER
jgi:TRAP-type C4-dicarboxylate transport system substrate-binding protein